MWPSAGHSNCRSLSCIIQRGKEKLNQLTGCKADRSRECRLVLRATEDNVARPSTRELDFVFSRDARGEGEWCKAPRLQGCNVARAEFAKRGAEHGPLCRTIGSDNSNSTIRVRMGASVAASPRWAYIKRASSCVTALSTSTSTTLQLCTLPNTHPARCLHSTGKHLPRLKSGHLFPP